MWCSIKPLSSKDPFPLIFTSVRFSALARPSSPKVVLQPRFANTYAQCHQFRPDTHSNEDETWSLPIVLLMFPCFSIICDTLSDLYLFRFAVQTVLFNAERSFYLSQAYNTPLHTCILSNYRYSSRASLSPMTPGSWKGVGSTNLLLYDRS